MPAYTAKKPEPAPEFFVPEGEYKFRVVEATDDTSKTGNEMIKLKLRVIREDETEGPALFDYLVFTESSFWKVDAYCASVGRDEIKDGETARLVGDVGRARLIVEAYNGKKNNKVDTYLFDEF